jgi:hypothetical protein
MIDRTEACFDLKKRLAADTAYRTGKFLGMASSSARTSSGTSERALYLPEWQLLRTSGTVHDGRTLLYRAAKRDCDACPLRARCCTRPGARKIRATSMRMPVTWLGGK